MKNDRCQICPGNLTQSAQQAFRVDRMDRRKVSCVERQLQGVFIYVQQVLVRGHQQGDLLHRSFCQNQTIVKLVFGNQTLAEQSSNELLADRLRCGIEFKGPDAPLLQASQSRSRQFLFIFTFTTGENEM